MQTVNYILVNEAGTQNAARIINGCHLADIGHHVIVNGSGKDADLIRELCHLRKHVNHHSSVPLFFNKLRE